MECSSYRNILMAWSNSTPLSCSSTISLTAYAFEHVIKFPCITTGRRSLDLFHNGFLKSVVILCCVHVVCILRSRWFVIRCILSRLACSTSSFVSTVNASQRRRCFLFRCFWEALVSRFRISNQLCNSM